MNNSAAASVMEAAAFKVHQIGFWQPVAVGFSNIPSKEQLRLLKFV